MPSEPPSRKSRTRTPEEKAARRSHARVTVWRAIHQAHLDRSHVVVQWWDRSHKYTFIGRGQAGTAKALERMGLGHYRSTDYYGSQFHINGLGKSAALKARRDRECGHRP